MSLSIKELNYDNLDELRKLESALKNWFANPKELNFTDSEMRFPFDMKKWINITSRNDFQFYRVECIWRSVEIRTSKMKC